MSNTRPFLVGFFTVAGHGTQTVATPLTGNGEVDHASLWSLITAKFRDVPRADIHRTGSTIEQRDESVDEQGIIEFPAGATIQQLFDKNDPDGSSLIAGSCEFEGNVCLVVLRFSHSRNAVGVSLLERSTHTTIRFSGTSTGQRLATDIPSVIAQLVGPGLKNFKSSLREIRPA